MQKENLYIGYIDGTLSETQARALEELLIDEGPEAKQELFEIKDIADTTLHGSMPVREQERKIIDLMEKAKRNDRRDRRRRLLMNVIGYASVAIVALVAGMYIFAVRDAKVEKVTQISACAGNKTDIILPDGTKIVLKSASVLAYDINGFGSEAREVHLNGEAYFDVAKDEDTKFVIHTQRQKVTVHGTTFNLQAYDNDKSNTLTLLEGDVSIDLFDTKGEKIRSVDVKPMEKCTWNLLTCRTNIEKIDNSEAGLGWKDNIFYFRDMSIEEMAERLEHYYDIDIALFGFGDGTVKFSGALSLNQNISETINILNYDGKLDILRIDDNHYSIRKKSN